MMKAAIYARHIDRAKIEDQINMCMQWANCNGLMVLPGHIHIDTETSLIDRVGYKSLMQVVRYKQVDVVLVEDLSRFSRAPQEVLQMMTEASASGVALLSVTECKNVSDQNPSLQLKAIINEIYINDLRQRTMLGQKHRGYFVGEKTFGYESVPFDQVLFDRSSRPHPMGYKMRILEEDAAVVMRIFHFFAEGVSPAKIAELLNQEKVPRKNKISREWTPRTVRRMLKNEKYIGRWSWGWWQSQRMPVTGQIKKVLRDKPLFEATYEDLRIIHEELWGQVQMKLALKP